MDPLMEIFKEAGPLAAFAAYLAWMQVKANQRHDKLVEDFQNQIDKLEDKRDADEEKLRDRYDSIMLRYDEERRQILEGISRDLQDIKQDRKNL